jgi:hypothetical protein
MVLSYAKKPWPQRLKRAAWVLGEFFAIDDAFISVKIGSAEIGKESP